MNALADKVHKQGMLHTHNTATLFNSHPYISIIAVNLVLTGATHVG